MLLLFHLYRSMGLSSFSRNSFMLQHLFVPMRFRLDGQNGRSIAFKQYEPRALNMRKINNNKNKQNYFLQFTWWIANNANTFSECSCPVKRYRLNRWWTDYYHRCDVPIFDVVAKNLSLFEIHSSVDMPRHMVALSIHDFHWKDCGP